MSRTRTPAAAAVLALTLSLSACGSGEDTKASEAISNEFQSNSGGGVALSKKDADCAGDGMVDEIGVDTLKEAGLITDDLTTNGDDVEFPEADADKAAAVMASCTDLISLILGQADDSVDEETTSCLREKLTEEDVESFLAASFAGAEPDGTDAITEATTECVTPG